MRQSHGDLLEFIFWRWEETASTEFLDKVSEKVEEGRGKKKDFPRGSVGWRSALVMAVALVTKKKKKKNWLLIIISVVLLTITHFLEERDSCQIC